MVSARLIAINIPSANEYITVQIATQYRQTNACTNKVIETETLDNLTAAVACVHLYSLNKREGQGVGGGKPPRLANHSKQWKMMEVVKTLRGMTKKHENMMKWKHHANVMEIPEQYENVTENDGNVKI